MGFLGSRPAATAFFCKHGLELFFHIQLQLIGLPGLLLRKVPERKISLPKRQIGIIIRIPLLQYLPPAVCKYGYLAVKAQDLFRRILKSPGFGFIVVEDRIWIIYTL